MLKRILKNSLQNRMRRGKQKLGLWKALINMVLVMDKFRVGKMFYVFSVSLLVLLLMSNFASAAITSLGDVFSSQPVKFLLGDFGSQPEGELFLVKFLVFIILFALVYKAAEKFPPLSNQRSVLVIISLAVSVLAIRYVTSEEVVNFMWLPYGVLGVTFATLFPFLLTFFFVKDWDSGVARKVVWSAFFVIFVGLAYMRWDSFALAGATVLPIDFVGPPGPAPWWLNLGMLYILIAVLSLLMILFDRSIRARMLHSELRGLDDRDKVIQAGALHNRIRKLRQQLAEAAPGDAQISRLEREIAELNKQIDSIMKRS